MSAVQNVKRPRVAGYQNQIPSESGGKLYLKSKMADVYFTFTRDNGSTKRIPAHKLLLAAASDVFEAMFYGDLKEKGDVQVVDVSDAAFEEFLQFFYISEIELTAENVAEVMGLGHKYNVTKCVDLCVQFLKDHLTNENTCTWLNVAILYQPNELLKLCDKQIAVNTSAVFKTADFLACDKRVLQHILKMNLLSCAESEVFEACMSWVKAKSNQDVVSKELVQEHLGDLFHEIRFTSMAVTDFLALYFSHKNLFSSDEFEDIIKKAGQFKSSPRQGVWSGDDVIVCNRKMPNSRQQSSYISVNYGTTFSSNEPILLGGFICTKVSFRRHPNFTEHQDLRSDLPIDVTIIEISGQNNNKILTNFRAELRSKSETEILLPEPILIRPGSFYEIQLHPFPEGHCYYATKLKAFVNVGSGITIQFRGVSIMTNPVEALLFNKI